VRGGATISARWPLPIGAMQVDDAPWRRHRRRLLAAHHRRTLHALLFGKGQEFGGLLLLEVLEIHGSSIWWGK
jgi:hypothetical protein